jgi:hypothetical protein
VSSYSSTVAMHLIGHVKGKKNSTQGERHPERVAHLHLRSRKGPESRLQPARYRFSDCTMTTVNTQLGTFFFLVSTWIRALVGSLTTEGPTTML